MRDCEPSTGPSHRPSSAGLEDQSESGVRRLTRAPLRRAGIGNETEGEVFGAAASKVPLGPDNGRDRAGQPLPTDRLALKLSSARLGQRIIFGAAVVFALAPLGLNPALLLQSVQGDR